MASVVARALVAVDAEKASKQDLELLKKLVMEFKDELDALGVKVDKIDKRVAVLEDRLGGWKLSGQFWFDANFAGGQDDGTSYTSNGKQNEFEKNRFRLTLTKQIDENTLFYAQFRSGSHASGADTGIGDMQFRARQVYVDAKLPYDISYRVGRFFYDPEGDRGLYVDNDATFGDYRMDGFQFGKKWGNFEARAWVGRNTQLDNGFMGVVDPNVSAGSDYMNYALEFFWQPNEKFFAGINGNWMVADEGIADALSLSFNTYDVYASYNFTPAIALQGMYYWQSHDDEWLGLDDDSKAWKAILKVDQSVLKFTALRVEYQQQKNNFIGVRDPYSFGVNNAQAASISQNMPWNNEETKFLFVLAEQKWNDKWGSYLRYGQADFSTDGLDDSKNYGIGITYQYTPAIAFRLAYDYVDYGDDNVYTDSYNGSDHVFQFRTSVNF